MDKKEQQKQEKTSSLRKDAKLDEKIGKITGAFAMQPITKPDSRYPKTNVARPSDESVEENRDWVNFNEK